MANVKEMRSRIGSVKSTQKITRALQMVAAAKLRRAQAQALAARPYALRMARVIANLARSVSGPSAPLLLTGTGKDQRHLIVVAASDRGLAGAINSNIVRAARERIASLTAQGKDVRIITIGRKARDGLRRQFGSSLVESYELGLKPPGFELVQPISQQIIDLYLAGEIDVVTLFYSRFKSVISQVPTARQLIPAIVDQAEEVGAPDLKGGTYSYEPDEESILETLLPRNIAVQLLAAVLENQAGFFASQMAAMDSATRNAGDLIKALTIQMNRTRQAQITKELIEIISGAAAV